MAEETPCKLLWTNCSVTLTDSGMAETAYNRNFSDISAAKPSWFPAQMFDATW